MTKSDPASRLSREEIYFADQVRLLREERGFSQEDLAEAVRSRDLPYVNQSTISRIENRTRPVRLMEAQILSELFGRTVHMMTHPDAPEEAFVAAEELQKDARFNYASLNDAALEFTRSQVALENELRRLHNKFGEGDDLEPQAAASYRELLTKMTRLKEIDLGKAVAEASAAYREHLLGSVSSRERVDPTRFAEADDG